MLSTEFLLWSAILVSLLALTVSLGCIIVVRSAAAQALASARYARHLDELREPESRIAGLSAEMTELHDAYDALLKSHKKLRSRITMRENRSRDVDSGGAADLSSESDKSKLRLAAKAQGLLK